jgi:cytochrome c oxidase accessory protein FixG
MTSGTGKVYAQSVIGKYRSIKNSVNYALLFVYFFGSWIRWNREQGLPNQAIMIDLPARKGYFFGLQIWSDEIYYITIILILSALALFIFTTLYGRLWCGYTCPQTVFTDFFIKIETFFQGDRNNRIRLNESCLSKEKFIKKSLTYLTWLLLAFIFAFSWVAYFQDVFDLTINVINFDLTFSTKIWLISLTFATFIFAGFLREKVCIYMCPYGRFQSAMIENNTKLVTYNHYRGEPRGKQLEQKAGDCIDCFRCVLVCPTGIDIRDGLQMECIGCGLCVDACNEVMEKIGKEKNLILYTSFNALKNGLTDEKLIKKIFKVKNLLYGAIFVIFTTFAINNLMNKSDINLVLIKERAPLFTITPNGQIRNTYILKIQNKSARPRKFIIYAESLEPYEIKIQSNDECFEKKCFINLDPELEDEFKIFIWSSNNLLHEKIFYLILEDIENDKIYKEKNMFIFN